ncbi:SPOR domain-containing protein [Marinilabiliaceae bacterium JC017]|nr:SPOR domain-containing protein [Marinilabiliaceae bacterium JC017]
MIKKNWIIMLFAMAVMSTACSSLSKTGSSSFDDSDSPYVEEEETTIATKPKPKPKPKAKSKIVVKEEKVKVIESSEPENETAKYYTIIGSFRVLDNARNYKKELFDEGFMPVILENENGLYRISVAAYNDEMPARDKITDIRLKYEKYSDVWLLIRKR